jgi:choice-of-anchor A domain-containing protein
MHRSLQLARLVLPTFVCFLSLTSQSFATPTNLGVANDFNGFIFGNLTATGGDTEGRLAVGGNFQATNYSVGAGGVGPALPNSFGTRDDLIVGGDMNAIGAWQVFYGNAVWGASLTAAPTIPVGNGTVFQGTPVNFAAAQADLVANSSVFMFSTLTLTGIDPLMNVFTVTESDWENSTDKQINVPAGATALINILGTSITQGGGLAVNGSNNPANPQGAYLLYHYPQATTINSNGIAMIGSVLAPYANLTLNAGGINGVGIAAAATQISGGEFHNFTFNGNIVPEPSSAVLALGCLVGLGWKLRRR